RLTNAEPLTPLLEKRSRDWLQCSIELSIPRDLPVRGAGLLSDAVDFLVHGAYRYNFFELPVRAAAYVRENQIILEVRDGGSSAGRTELMELSSPQGQLAAHRDSTRGRYYVGLFLVSVWCVAQILDARLESEYLDNETVFRIIVPCSEEGTGLEHLQPSSA
ncbi:MAG TPA: hypothetical protein VFK05_20215, partial [Polyangiaceae bacterium]|nr:hypothetical protein [Polyangiaceae bacterium]